MIAKIIREYMEGGHKKLTVPGFGTFMRKDSGDIIFVGLLRKDDGMLRGLVEKFGHYSEVEAMALVDRFIFEVRNGIEKNGSAPLDGFGTMYLDESGQYQFERLPQARTPVRESAAAPPPPIPKTHQPVRRTVETPVRKPSALPARPRPEAYAPQRKSTPAARRKPPKSKPDILIIVALVAAAIALTIIIFGLSAGTLPFLNK